MILGRNTQQWLGLIGALNGLLLIVIPTLVPAINPAQLGVVLGAVAIFLGSLVAFIANTYTTPAGDPQIEQDTMIRVTDSDGRVIGHQALTLLPDRIAPPTMRTTTGRFAPKTHSDNPPKPKE